MLSIKRLRSVAQSIAHHSISGLCYVHPHLGKECKNAKINLVKLNLLQFSFTPQLEPISKELYLSAIALKDKFVELLKSENIDISSIKTAYAQFSFLQDFYPDNCNVHIVTNDIKIIDITVNSLGSTLK